MDGPPEDGAASMDGPPEDDVVLLADEKFDFDLSLSSSSANEDDEVFFGPVGHKERCVAASLELNHPVPEEPLLPASDGRVAWSPLAGEKFVEVYTEARLLALQIETSSRAQAARPEAPSGQGAEHFIQEAQSKISLFERENWAKKSPQSLKRETYCLPDAPLRGPPPSAAQRPVGLPPTRGPPQLSRPLLLGPRTARPPEQAGPQKKAASKLLPPRAAGARGDPWAWRQERLLPSEPLGEPRSVGWRQQVAFLERGDVALVREAWGVAGGGGSGHPFWAVLFLAPGDIWCWGAWGAAGWAWLRDGQGEGSQGALSCTPCWCWPGPLLGPVTRGEQSPPRPGAGEGGRQRLCFPGALACPVSGHLVLTQRTKPFQPAREMPASPSRGKLPGEKEPQGDVPSVPSSVAGDITGLPAGDSHAAPGKRSLPVPHKLGLRRTLLRAPGGAGSLARRPSSLGSAPRKAAGAALAPGPAKPGGRPGAPTDGPPPPPDPGRPGSSTAALPRTPAHGGPGPRARPSLTQSSQPSGTGGARRRGSSLGPKPEGAPAPANPFKIPKFSAGEPPDSTTPQPLWAQRPQSCTSAGRPALHSTPARCLSTPATQSCSHGARTPASIRRLSALPTPAGRRLSSLPLATPRTMPRALASPLCVTARQLSPEPQEKPLVRAAPLGESGDQAAPGRPDTSPDSSFSPPSAVPQALNFSPEKNDFPFSPSVPTQVAPDETRPLSDTSPREAILVDIRLDELMITPKVESTPLIDLPLIDFGNTPEANAALGLESRPLIDLLVNTPDLSRGAPPKPIHEVVQLIDLTSPLIQLSPEADKENVDSPLLKF
ncbi:G2 and S phase-expressed protein 1 [Talpa occidentalis]|uniref:G2 and S phase-expressed protein 1 n=1 Tax=Talpa occidentalis TaxID=50954 RepID=UPI00188E28CA|nr:G2 and S phase-expressed protein 1 [Talpa occidentalis]